MKTNSNQSGIYSFVDHYSFDINRLVFNMWCRNIVKKCEHLTFVTSEEQNEMIDKIKFISFVRFQHFLRFQSKLNKLHQRSLTFDRIHFLLCIYSSTLCWVLLRSLILNGTFSFVHHVSSNLTEHLTTLSIAIKYNERTKKDPNNPLAESPVLIRFCDISVDFSSLSNQKTFSSI